MFDQICLSPQVKPSVIISNKHGIHCCRRSCWTTFGDLLFLMELVLLLERKIYITLNLSSAPVLGLQKEKEIINTLTRVLYICCFYYVEILKHAQDPHKYILACRISSQQRVFLFYIRTSEEWKERRI